MRVKALLMLLLLLMMMVIATIILILQHHYYYAQRVTARPNTLRCKDLLASLTFANEKLMLFVHF